MSFLTKRPRPRIGRSGPPSGRVPPGGRAAELPGSAACAPGRAHELCRSAGPHCRGALPGSRQHCRSAVQQCLSANRQCPPRRPALPSPGQGTALSADQLCSLPGMTALLSPQNSSASPRVSTASAQSAVPRRARGCARLLPRRSPRELPILVYRSRTDLRTRQTHARMATARVASGVQRLETCQQRVACAALQSCR